MELFTQLTQNLGVTEEQAKGGTALIMKMAREKLGKNDFGQIAQTIPGLDNIIKAAPETSGIAKALDTVTSKVGGDKLENLTGLSTGFSKLGLDANMVTRFVPIVLSYVEKKAGNTTRNILEQVLK